ncbi:hypothetical protein QYM36_008742 [Artemia franciscana]|uniref:Ubiquitin carboxyl-terminal hydrolase 7 n=1 Tax=Artemia franciscana TaxID=6661 RepID=A0AA88LAI9_ARTSF|nr:hypothetical protein QYM36_008742 [Artemia franciscana]
MGGGVICSDEPDGDFSVDSLEEFPEVARMEIENPNPPVQPKDIEMDASGDERHDGDDMLIDQPSVGSDDDESRPEATFRYVIPNFSRLRESSLSDATIVRNLPWKIMAMPRNVLNQQERTQQKSLGFFLQCNGDSDSASWSCQATAELRLVSQKEGIESFTRKIQHLFYAKENDWGFSHFMSWADICDPDKGYIKDDCVILEVHVAAEAPHGVSWDSKKHTGYVGLKNQGATCYMNSLLQTLYFTNQLKKAVYKMPTESDDSTRSVALALQRVFYELQFSDKPVGTKKLTKSFGWETLDSFMQHDVQEFLRVLLDKLESKMKSTCVEGTVPKLFEGKTLSFIKCKHVNYTSSRAESYYDIQLNIKGKKNIYESFKDYITTETLDGDNKYDAGEHGLQEAEKGVIFQTFPPVLHLHLMRFQYDPITDCSVKFNDRFEFYEKLDLTEFIQSPDPESKATYTLHAVLVHSGDNHGGHYVVFINPKGDGKWCKFDDDVVSKCSKSEAVDNNFGGPDEDSPLTAKQCTNAYMLVYIRDSELKTVLQEVAEADIPEELVERLNEERKQDAARRKERNEAHLYMSVNVIFEDEFNGYQGFDLYDGERLNPRMFRVLKTQTVEQTIKIIADTLNYPPDQIRLWPIQLRNNNTVRPRALNQEEYSKMVSEVCDQGSTWYVLCEMAPPDSKTGLQSFSPQTDVLLFLKYYDPRIRKLHYAGHIYVPLTANLQSVVPVLNERVGLPSNTELILFEEIRPSLVERIDDLQGPIESVLEELMDGDIIVYQKKDADDMQMELGIARDYYRDLFLRVDVTFSDKSNPNDPGFTLEMSQKMDYDSLARAVAEYLGVDPYHLQFFKSQPNHRDVSSSALRCTFEGTLKDIFSGCKSRQPKRLYYQLLSIPINELENKRQIKCLVVGPKYKEEREIMLYPNKQATIGEMLDEAKRQVPLSENGSGELRLLEIHGCKIQGILPPDRPVDDINMGTGKTYRIEEIPKEEMELANDEMLVPVTHYTKEVFSTFGIPFYLKIKDGELYSEVRMRIQKKLDIPDKEFEKDHDVANNGKNSLTLER